MNTYLFRARDSKGASVRGRRDAESLDEIKKYLAEKGLIPIQVEKESSSIISLDLDIKSLLKEKVRTNDLLVMTRQFYSLFKAGMSMEAVLSTLVKQANNKTLKEVLQKVRVDVSAGDSLSKAFGKHEEVFGELYVNMVAAGEEAGILEDVLNNVTEVLEKEAKLKSSISSATMYPKIVLFSLVVGMFTIMNMVVPRFQSFFEHYDAELPLPTRIIIGVSDFSRDYWYLLLLTCIFLIFMYKRFSRTSRGKLKLGQLKFKLPVFGDLNLKVANSRFCYILSALYRSGLPMTRCLEIAGKTIENGAFSREVDILRSEVTRGKMLSDGMIQSKYFTPVIIDATAVGEKTGTLDDMLLNMGRHYDLEVEHTTKNLTTLLEPILLFFSFGMVVVFALAILLPMWNISKAVSG